MMVLREEDKALFSLKEMQIYKFNDSGFEILKQISKATMGLNEIKQLVTEQQHISESDFDSFIKKSLEHNILVNAQG